MNKKTAKNIYKGVMALLALIASLMMICPLFVSKLGYLSSSVNLFDIWSGGLKDEPADYTIMAILFSILFFLGIILAICAIVNMCVKNKTLISLFKIFAVLMAIFALVGIICNITFVASHETLSIGIGGILSTVFAILLTTMSLIENKFVR